LSEKFVKENSVEKTVDIDKILSSLCNDDNTMKPVDTSHHCCQEHQDYLEPIIATCCHCKISNETIQDYNELIQMSSERESQDDLLDALGLYLTALTLCDQDKQLHLDLLLF